MVKYRWIKISLICTALLGYALSGILFYNALKRNLNVRQLTELEGVLIADDLTDSSRNPCYYWRIKTGDQEIQLFCDETIAFDKAKYVNEVSIGSTIIATVDSMDMESNVCPLPILGMKMGDKEFLAVDSFLLSIKIGKILFLLLSILFFVASCYLCIAAKRFNFSRPDLGWK